MPSEPLRFQSWVIFSEGDRDVQRFMPALTYSIVTVTYDEAGNIARFLEAVADAVRPLGGPFEIIVVDDNSPDGTGRIVEEAAAGAVPEARLVSRLDERGIGSAYRRGVHEARGGIVALMDADFSHPPAELGALLRGAESGADHQTEQQPAGTQLAPSTHGDRLRDRRSGRARLIRHPSL